MLSWARAKNHPSGITIRFPRKTGRLDVAQKCLGCLGFDAAMAILGGRKIFNAKQCFRAFYGQNRLL